MVKAIPAEVRNRNTNEVISEGFYAYTEVKSRHPFRKWCALNLDMDIDAIRSVKSSTALHVLFYMISRMDNGNRFFETQAEMSAGLKVPAQQQISRAVGDLLSEGLIHRGRRMGGSYEYIIDERMIWRGAVKDYPWKSLPRAAPKRKELLLKEAE